jgi:integrase
MRDLAALYLAKHDSKWSNAKHRREWKSSLDRLVLPIIGNMAASDVETAHVLKVLEPIWTRIPETADRVRGRIEALLDFAKVAGLRDGDNPARWDGHLAALLPAPKALKPTTHHPALAYADVPDFVVALRAETSVEARALEVIVLTAVRLSEAIYARWGEVDLGSKTWTIPAERMKRRKAHVVPLSDRVLAIFTELRSQRGDPADTDFVFPGRFADKPISDNSIDRLRVRLTAGRATTHGFRAAFRTWAAERTSFPEAVCEQALAHAVKGSVIRAYQRSSLLDKRVLLMAKWAEYCNAPVATGSTVVALRGAHG